jgi:RNA polymerase sigma-70 factor (ECF subfamily)
MSTHAEAAIHEAWSSHAYDRAFSLMAQHYASDFYRTALRIVLDHATAQDVVQDASVKMWRALPKFKGDSKFSTWAYRIVVNEALGALRKSKNILRSLEDVDIGVPDSPHFEADRLLADLYRALANLPERQRLTFQLRYFDDKPYSEISEILGTSVGGLKANYHHAVERIKMEMRELNPDYDFESNE